MRPLYWVPLFAALAACGALGSEIRVLVPIWITELGANESFDSLSTQVEAVSFLLAMKHFNDRRTDILPALSSVMHCPKNISIVAVCDDSGNARRVTHILQEFSGEYDIVSGLSSIAARDAITFADANIGAPVLSHWASEELLANKQIYPLFSRTCIADKAYYSKIASFVAQLGFTQVSILYTEDDTVPSINTALTKALLANRVEGLSFSYIYEDPDSIYEALREVKASDRNVIVYLGWEEDLSQYIHAMAGELGLDTVEKVWLFTTVDNYPTDATIAANPTLKKFLAGSFYFEFTNPDQTLANNFRSKITTEFASDGTLVPFMNTRLPPFGAKNISGGSCKNDELDFSLSPDYFSVLDSSIFGIAQAAAYDAIMTIGIAACSDPSPTLPANGAAFVNLIRAVNFEGLSGRVRFETDDGDRSETSAVFTVSNWKLGADDHLILERVGEFNISSWTFYDANTIQLRAGMGLDALPGDFTKPTEERNYLPAGLIILGYVEVILGVLASLLCLAWMFSNRDSPVIRAMQPAFMTTMCFGCIVVSFAILPLTADDSPSNPIQGNKSSCMSQVYLFFLGAQMMLGSIVGKTLRAYFIFERNSLYHQHVRQYHVLLFIGILMAIDLALLISMEYMAPYTYSRSTMALDLHGQVTESRGECSFAVYPESLGFLAGLLVIYGILIFSLRFVSGLSSKRFMEEFHLSTTLIQLIVLVIPATVAAFSSVIGRFVIISTYFLVCVVIVLTMSFYPKYSMMKHQQQRTAFEERVRKEKRDNPNNTNDVDVLDGLRIPKVQAKFERFAEENYVTESYLFVVDGLTYKEQFEKQSNQWRMEKATSIVKIYIQVGSLLQVNISGRCREMTLQRFKRVLTGREVLDDYLFDAALKEVADMLNFGAWAQFVNEGGMFNAHNSLNGGGSKVLGWFATVSRDPPLESASNKKNLSSSQVYDIQASSAV